MPATPRIRRTPQPLPGRRQRHREEIRNRLFRAALQLFAERGFLETTVEDITEAADVGKGTFFNYFPTKEHILATFGAERLSTLEQYVIRARAPQTPVLPILRELAINLAGQASESAALLRAIYAAHASCADVRIELEKRLHAGRRLVREMFALAQQRGEIRSDRDPGDLARLMQVIFHGITLAWALNPDAPLRHTSEGVWDIFCHSLLVDAHRPHHRTRARRSRRSI